MNYKILPLFLFFFVLTFSASTGSAMLLAGEPDPTFGTNGRVLTSIKTNVVNGVNYADMILQPDGKIIVFSSVAEVVNGITSYRLHLIRLNPDGVRDASFGAGGIANVAIETAPQGNLLARFLHLLPDGKILVVFTVDDDFGIARLYSNGSRDWSFGTNGMVRTDFAEPFESSKEMIKGFFARPNGKFLIAGVSEIRNGGFACPDLACANPPYTRFAIAQYNTDGTLDTTFGDGGLRKDRFYYLGNNFTKAALGADGKLTLFTYLTRESTPTGGTIYDFGAARYNENGTIDNTWGTNGILTFTNPSHLYCPLNDGKFLAYQYHTSGEKRIYRFNLDFSTDTTFGTNGMIRDTRDMQPTGLDSQPDGKFILSGYAWGLSYLKRYLPNGAVDTTFGTDGEIMFDLDGDSRLISAPVKVVLQPDGKILVVGPLFVGDFGIAVMRFGGESEPTLFEKD